ncbi:hypothetical protein MPH_04824 [Macrophomina phaseolina MS6]|uniref:Uncharacterized protein n=1 Tax=Macrophomina phaseolina (strain MS6) TaxID=1126212 RepID=K2SM77_MACPH|nr:hypothetical protein MPH_04824 [Macrophomina phaseolina MS6]
MDPPSHARVLHPDPSSTNTETNYVKPRQRATPFDSTAVFEMVRPPLLAARQPKPRSSTRTKTLNPRFVRLHTPFSRSMDGSTKTHLRILSRWALAW